MGSILHLVPAFRLWMGWLVAVVAIAMAWIFLGDQSGGWPELARFLGLLTVGTVIGVTATQGGRDGESEPSLVDRMTTEDLFFDALNRELCRARREEASFVVLSLDRQEEYNDTSLSRVCELLDAELRAYADIAQVGERLLALVPDVEDSQCEPLLRRLTGRLATECGEIRIGLARFPQDAVCAKDLIDMADRKRCVKGVSRISSVSHEQASGQMSS